MSTTHDAPTLLPDLRALVGEAAGSTGGALSAPSLDHLDPAAAGAATGTGPAAPTASPPGTVGDRSGAQAGDQGLTGTWTTNVTVDALWTIDETRNAFLHVAGGAWKKVHNGRDGAYAALLTLASQARQTGRPVSLREEADGMVHEIYLW